MEANIFRSRETVDIVWIASHLQKYKRRKIMKLSRIVLMLGLLPVLVACSPMKNDTCPDRHVNLIAKIGNKSKPSILQVKPDTIVVKEGCEFEVRFTGDISVSTVGGKESAVEGGKNWLSKPAQSSSPIKIKAPSGTAQEEPYKYAIVVDKIGTLDPRARVTD
jgi:hypothetical protein